MTDPQTVISPKDMWTLLAVLYCSNEKEHGWSIALGQWDGVSRLAVRWNGDKAHPKGNPTSRGIPTWFVAPEELESHLLAYEGITAEKRTLAEVVLRKVSAI